MPDAIENGIAQPDVRRVHVDLCTQCARAIGKIARFHSREQIEIFLGRAVAKATGLSEATICIRLLWCHVANIGLAFADEINRVFAKPVEIIRRIKRRAADMFIRPAINQPVHVSHD